MQVKFITKISDIGTLFKADLFYRILVYSGLGFDRFHCIDFMADYIVLGMMIWYC
jgi:hypothetical protein